MKKFQLKIGYSRVGNAKAMYYLTFTESEKDTVGFICGNSKQVISIIRNQFGIVDTDLSNLVTLARTNGEVQLTLGHMK